MQRLVLACIVLFVAACQKSAKLESVTGIANETQTAPANEPSQNSGGKTPVALQGAFQSEELTAAFALKIDRAHEILNSEFLEPKSAPVQILKGSASEAASGWNDVYAFVKQVPARPDVIQLEVILENKRSDVALQNVALQLREGHVIDMSNDPFATQELAQDAVIKVGGIAKLGLARLVLAIPKGNLQNEAAQVDVHFSLSAVTSPFEAKSSNTMATSSDGSEVWAVVTGSRTIAVIDSQKDAKVYELEIPGTAASIAISPNDKWVIAASSDTNKVFLIDRSSRKVLQTVDEVSHQGRDLRAVVVSPQGDAVYVAGYVSGTITKFKLNETDASLQFDGTLSIGKKPTHMSVTPSGDRIYVSHFLPRGKIFENEAWVSLLATAPLALEREISFVDSFNLKESECLRKAYETQFPEATPKDLTTEGTFSQFSGAFLEPGGRYAVVPGVRVPGGVAVVEIGPNHKEISNTDFFGKGLFSTALDVVIDARDPARPAPLLHHGILDQIDASMAHISCARFAMELDNPHAVEVGPNRVVSIGANIANGTNGLERLAPERYVAFTKGGRILLKLHYASDELSTQDMATFHPNTRSSLELSGSNPNGLLVLPNGKKAYVSYANTLKLSVLDLSDFASDQGLPKPFYLPWRWSTDPRFIRAGGFLTRYRPERDLSTIDANGTVRETGAIELAQVDPMAANMRRGKILFESSNPKKHPSLSVTNVSSCGGCHPNGESDGSMWTTMEGERKTTALYGGIRGRGWLHASATHVDAHEFASAILNERLGGNLSEEDTAALSSYVADGIAKLQAPATDPAMVALGEKLFAKNCAGCHAGSRMTSGNPDPVNPFGGGSAEGPFLYDLGTASDFSWAATPLLFEKMRLRLPEGRALAMIRGDRELGENDFVQQYFDFRPRPNRAKGAFKAPALTNVWHNTLFFHDGRFDSLEQVVTFFNEKFNLGMDPSDQRNIIEYLKTL